MNVQKIVTALNDQPLCTGELIHGGARCVAGALLHSIGWTDEQLQKFQDSIAPGAVSVEQTYKVWSEALAKAEPRILSEFEMVVDDLASLMTDFDKMDMDPETGLTRDEVVKYLGWDVSVT